MRTINKYIWLWALVLTAFLYMGCTTSILRDPHEECLHTLSKLNAWLYQRDNQMLLNSSALQSCHKIVSWECKGPDSVTADVILSLQYIQEIPGKGKLTLCSKVAIQLIARQDEMGYIKVSYGNMSIIQLKVCNGESII